MELIEDKSWNKFEVNVNHPIDIERMPKSKEVILKKKKAYFYERGGKEIKSLLPLILLK